MKLHKQNANKNHHPFWDLVVTENVDDTISIPAGSFYLQGKEYNLEAVTNKSFPDKSRLFVEKVGEDTDYYLDSTSYGEPNSFAPQVGAILVVWNEGGEVHCLRSVEL